MFYGIITKNGNIARDSEGRLMIFNSYRKAAQFIVEIVSIDEHVEIIKVKVFGEK